MNWLSITTALLNLFLFGAMALYNNHCKKLADIAAARDEAFEAEKGKLEATKEAVDNILKEIEQMKASVSLEEQRRHDFIIERNQKLMNLLRYAEQVNISKQTLLTAISNESLTRLEDLHTSLNETMLNLRSDLMYLIVFHETIGKDKCVADFGDEIFYQASEVIVRVTNAVATIETMNKQFNYGMESPDLKDKANWIHKAAETKKKLEEMKKHTPYENIKKFDEAQVDYLVFLRQIYDSDTFMKYRS